MTKETRLATLAALLGNAIFGFSFMFSRIALGIAQPFVMLMYRFIGAFLGLNLLALWSVLSGRNRRQTDGRIDSMRFSLKGKPVLPLLALGVVQPVIYFLCESYGISLTNATFSGVIIALVPIVGLALGAGPAGERGRGQTAGAGEKDRPEKPVGLSGKGPGGTSEIRRGDRAGGFQIRGYPVCGGEVEV